MKRFQGKNIVITGGTRGIGQELCVRFAEEGANVAFCYRNSDEQALNIAKKIELLGQKCLYFQATVDDYNLIVRMMERINTEFGSIDILINNAGILKVGVFAGMKPEDWQDMISTNLNGLFVCTKTALPYLIKKKGVIINISSFMAFRPAGPAQAVYAATKAGIIGFSRSLAKEVSSVGVRVNVIAPGLVDTDMIKPLGEKVINDILAQTLSKRIATTDEIANTVLFIASDESKYINGQTIVIDGGGVNFQF
ncbi:MAG: 3-oxoacyl-ACP reductase FabG [Firmicutes bacterium]|nr:3-oxoacyl-ACP reductase FabG [Bacillota bacterium]